MAKQKSVLGKGLGALLNSMDDEHLAHEISFIEIDNIIPMSNQPRKVFDNNKINNLAESIKKYGVLQPIIVRKDNGNFKIIAGERRWRAAKIAGIDEIPAIIKENIDDVTVFEMSLIENLQREDLNPIEEAESYKKLLEAFNYTHDKLANLIGKNRTYITNSIRLLKLAEKVKDGLINGNISVGHCKLLASLPEGKQIELFEIIVKNNLSVRDFENLLNRSRQKTVNKKELPTLFKEEISKVSKKYNTKVDLKIGKKSNGKLIIYFKNEEELKNLIKDLTC